MNTEVQKKYFKEWLKLKNLSEATILSYSESVLEKINEVIISSNDDKVKSLNPNMYAYTDLKSYEKFYTILKSDPNFDIVNRTGQPQANWLKTPLNHYRKFLLERESKVSNFTWIPFYKEFANKLLEYQNNRPELINKIKDIFLRMSNLTLPTLERDNNIIDIDPFTVFGLFNKGITNNNRLELISLIKESFNINADIPKDFNGIPVLNNQKSTFYYFIGGRSDNDINNLWDLYKVALDYEKNSLPILEANFDNIFNTVKGQQGVKWNITMGLFWISPYMFINLDSKNRTVLQKESFISGVIKQKLKVFGNNLPTGKDYLDFCKQLRSELANNKNGINDFPAFSFYADRTINYTINDDDFNDKEIDKMNIPLNQILYGPPGTGKTYNTVLKAMSIIDNTEYKDVSEEQYSALKTRFDELKQAGQIVFVTFHQSYSYEEFVEGIKPYIPEWGTTDNTEVRYIGENGIFKEICKNARQIKTDKTSHKIDFSKTRIFKMSLGANWENETEDIYNYCLTNNVVALGWGDDKDFSGCNTSEEFKNLDSTWGAKAVEIFKNWMRVGDIILISNGNSNIKAIAQITGEYEYHNDREIRYCQFRNVNWLYNGDDIPVAKFYDKKLSQQAIYGFYNKDKEGKDDYNSSINTNVLNEIITGNINSAEERPYILIIDEINRGDVSKIFGELITLIEEDKRIGNKYQMKITLPYSKEPFGVPNNLYIIGTMNTADRSIALLDTALRRRFDFEEIMPRPELLGGKVVEGINLQTLLTRINERITNKYDRDHQIGHSYLMGVNTKEQLERAYKNRILPLLNEYFYNESKTVAEILNCSEDELKTGDFISILGKAQGA